ncbi:alpha-amylase family glycosyl hydrolase [Aestuariibacter sp. AA17]|uniref:Alpha-amylase family glycosyl hydrolase n=1 Tax=Fluctibacter corallii TaxID=2984329 RepID=A0ABT3ADJ0_9ALTE|nr:amylosucrase [Aestuariibacter sp. AA17]MCV2886306.1 alpha-amylase family glycosyl hydrolase [Aestuariibacter sp. AA17]
MSTKYDSQRGLDRLLKEIDMSMLTPSDKRVFLARLSEHFEALFSHFTHVYGYHYDCYYHLRALLNTLAKNLSERTESLKALDASRLSNPHWYAHHSMLGMACYVDLFAGDLQRLKARIPYLQSLGVTYLHLMPLYRSPEGDSDGGYAVSDYRQVDPKLGTVSDLQSLATELRNAGISLILDFVFNHTSDEHAWAMAAKGGDKNFQHYYYMFDDKSIPNQYEPHLREIFPQVRRGNFTFDSTSRKWIWTTFNNFQWDLNYTNPEVFTAITDEMLFLANLGCEGLRLDALAFIWKEMGTDCENQPKAHTIIQAFNLCLKIAAPAVVFKSEAIVHPDEVVKYIDKEECQLSYNPLLMALIWNSLATRKTRLLTASMQKSFSISPDCVWVNYVRCHDDIGWTFDDNVAWQLGINPHDHRQFLNAYYTGQFEGSFANGVAFGENPNTGDCRVCGSLASLVGLEDALADNSIERIKTAIDRIMLTHAIILSIGGIPLIYSGDEVGLLNDYEYRTQPDKQHDDRWVHRIPLTDQDIAASQKQGTVQQQISARLQHLIQLRKTYPVFGAGNTTIIGTENQHVFVFLRQSSASDSVSVKSQNDNNTDETPTQLLALFNFTEHTQQVDAKYLAQLKAPHLFDLVSEEPLSHETTITLAPYQIRWIVPKTPTFYS